MNIFLQISTTLILNLDDVKRGIKKEEKALAEVKEELEEVVGGLEEEMLAKEEEEPMIHANLQIIGKLMMMMVRRRRKRLHENLGWFIGRGRIIKEKGQLLSLLNLK